MRSHFVNMLITALILSTALHQLYYDRKTHKWHHHFLTYFGFLFIGGLGLAWLMYLTEPAPYY
ncbi:MAG: hypothetical protein H6510_06920 [Acidobacteria bacterium]|nr:hypothetical protein [Acidobacteriota bacterium]MCB9397526.1 hypothetical protein [Acidobacteriota bacterium]